MLNANPDGHDIHPTGEQLFSLVHGCELDKELVLQLEQHLQLCELCQRRASDALPDRLEQKIRQFADPGKQGPAKLGNGYELVEEVGRGASGVVYRAVHRGLDRSVALKMLVSGAKASPAELVRFHRESEALARMNHPHIVQVFDVGEQDGVPFLAMEWIEGPTLADYLRSNTISPGQSAEILISLAEGIGHAHKNGILHRDLKPQNILISRNLPLSELRSKADCTSPSESGKSPSSGLADSLKIVDFGLARFSDSQAFQTRTGETLGTPSYMAPEQIAGNPGLLKPTTDVYGLGAILYECLTGRPPFHGNSPLETIQLVVQRDPTPVEELRPGMPRDLAIICHRCLAKNPSARFQSAADLAADLRRFLGGEAIQSRSVSKLERGLRWSRRNPWPISVAALLIAATVLTITGQMAFQRKLGHQRDLAVSNYQESRAAIWKMLGAIGNESVFDIPRLQELQNSQMESALNLFETLAKQEGTTDAKFDLAKIEMMYGTRQVAEGNYEAGQRMLELSRDLLEQLVELSPEDKQVLQALVVNQVKTAATLASAGKNDESIQILEAMMPVATQLATGENLDSSTADLVAWARHSLGNSLVAIGNNERAMVEYQSAVSIRKDELAEHPENDKLLRYLAESQVCLGLCQMTLGMPEADATFQHAIRSLELIRKRNPKDPNAILAMAAALLNRSNILANRENNLAAIDACTNGIELVGVLLQADPSNFDAMHYESMLYGNRAMFKSHDGSTADAIADWELALRSCVDDQTRKSCRINLVLDLISINSIDTAIAKLTQYEAEDLNNDEKFVAASGWCRILDALEQIRNESRASAHETRIQCDRHIQRILTGLSDNGWLAENPEAREAIFFGDKFNSFRKRMSGEYLNNLISRTGENNQAATRDRLLPATASPIMPNNRPADGSGMELR